MPDQPLDTKETIEEITDEMTDFIVFQIEDTIPEIAVKTLLMVPLIPFQVLEIN